MQENKPGFNLARKKMIVCVGAGGVGKTSWVAATALHSAGSGKRVAGLTVDPAKRLSESLGVSGQVADGRLKNISSVLKGTEHKKGKLYFGMLDARFMLEAVIREKASSQRNANRILNNRLYRYVSTSLGGIQEYVALERLCTLHDESDLDLIVLDTPPADNAINLFSAPKKMKTALMGPLVRMMRRIYGGSKSRFDLVGRWSMSVFNILKRVTGAALLDEMMEFVDALSDLFGDFFERAQRFQRVLASDDVAIVMVTTPDEGSIKEALEFEEAIEKEGFYVDGFIFNKCHYPPASEPLPDGIKGSSREKLLLLNSKWNEKARLESELIEDFAKHHRHKGFVCIIPALVPQRSSSPDGRRLDFLDNMWNSMIEI